MWYLSDNTPTASEVLQSLPFIKFREFNQYDWYAFAGCESAKPLINNVELGNWIVIIDGDVVSVMFYDTQTDHFDNKDILFTLKAD